MYNWKNIIKPTIMLMGLVSMSCSSNRHADSLTLILGTYTSGDSKGIYTCDFDQNLGCAGELTMVEIDNPSFMALSSDNRYLYSVSENNTSDDAVSRFELDQSSGKLSYKESEITQSKAPCYITTGDGWLATANYVGGTISTFPLDQNGAVEPLQQQISFGVSDSTTLSHIHCLVPSSDGEYLFATDLGRDSIYRFKVSSVENIKRDRPILEQLTPSIELDSGSGPRHLKFAPNGRYAYLINEIKGTVVAFSYSDGGYLTKFQEIAADSLSGNGSADIQISPDGDFLYASNRLKADGIAIFSIDNLSGELTKVGYCDTGIHPRNFCITPNGEFLLVACRDSNAIQIYKRDMKTGLLDYTGSNFDIKLDKPVFVTTVM